MSFKSYSRNLLSRCVNWTLSNPLLVLLIIGLLTIFAWQYTVNNLSINTDNTDMIAPDAPFIKIAAIMKRPFRKMFIRYYW